LGQYPRIVEPPMLPTVPLSASNALSAFDGARSCRPAPMIAASATLARALATTLVPGPCLRPTRPTHDIYDQLGSRTFVVMLRSPQASPATSLAAPTWRWRPVRGSGACAYAADDLCRGSWFLAVCLVLCRGSWFLAVCLVGP